MSWSVEIVTPAAVEPMTLEQAKQQLNIEPAVTDWDTLITDYIKAARAAAERYCERAIIDQVRVLHLDTFPKVIELPGGVVLAVEDITYLDADRSEHVLDEAAYHTHLAGNPPSIEALGCWPTTARVRGAVAVAYRCGWADPADVPDDIIQAMKVLMTHWFSVREAVNVGNITSELPWGTTHLLDRWSLRVPIG